MYVKIDNEWRGLDFVRKVSIVFDDGSLITVSEKDNKAKLSIKHGPSSMTHSAPLEEWNDAALVYRGQSVPRK